MPAALEILEPIQAALVPVPAEQPGVCSVCRAGLDPRYARCFSCNQAWSALGPLEAVLPIAMSVHNEQFHFTLNRYKRGGDAVAQRQMALRLAALLVVFLDRHHTCLAGWDVIVPVPSPRGVALRTVLDLTAYRDRTVYALTAQRDSEGRPLDPSRFDVGVIDRDARVLLLDDTFASGASLFSARAALSNAGVTVADAVVLGRHLHPDKWPPAQQLLSWLGDRPWVPERCGRCGGEWQSTPALF